MKFILNCSSSEMTFGEYTAEFLYNGNTINYIRYFRGICYKTVNMSVCDSLICDCYVDWDTSWYSITIEKPADGDKFSCLIRERETCADHVYALEGIWSRNESKSHVIQVAHTAPHPRQCKWTLCFFHCLLIVLLFTWYKSPDVSIIRGLETSY